MQNNEIRAFESHYRIRLGLHYQVNHLDQVLSMFSVYKIGNYSGKLKNWPNREAFSCSKGVRASD